MIRPERVVVVVGTGTDIGKTWVTCRIIEHLLNIGYSVGARKPAQSFDPAMNEPTDAHLLALAVGVEPTEVCPAHRWYTVPMAPPMAAEAIGLAPPTLAQLVQELGFDPVPTATSTINKAPTEGTAVESRIDVLFVETAGGVRSPHAANPPADAIDLLDAIHPDHVLLVADAGLGTINSIRLTLAALLPWDVVVVLNRFDAENPLHCANLSVLKTDAQSAIGRRTPILTDLRDVASTLLGRPPPPSVVP